MFVLFLAFGFWVLGHFLKTPKPQRWAMIAALLIAAMVLAWLLPPDHAAQQLLGGGPAPWALLLGVGGVIWAYRYGLNRLRARAAQTPQSPPKQTSSFNSTELERYARHIVLRELGGPGQKRLKKACVLVIGAGGLGSPALLYLAGAGVGTIGVIDDDVVDNSNLQRQVLHRDANIGMPKVFSAAEAMRALNPFVTVRPFHRRLTPDVAADLFADFDLVLDGTDNFDTRYLANKTAVAQGIPLVSGALTQWEGQISVFDPAKGAPCYHCIFPQAPDRALAPACAEAGVLGPLPGVVGSMMAVETVKTLTNAGQPLRGSMLIYDALYGETRKIGLKRRGDCPVCGAGAVDSAGGTA